ncbi:cupin domain-containing protein [Gordonia phthalatica]|uniref:Cupin n=1 Tax=Gordonia phthalatica TaxID=1136941 RepID=A0A0N9MT77_9ACTN|nr:cupin domain-containing protein [Gordonia phthalatica]ALG86346.1 cupin [Gordonia phthalatica]
MDYQTADLAEYADSIILTRESRYEDWDALGFQTKAGEQFARAQIRYVGSGATGDHSNDTRTIKSQGFTFSNMLLPAGAEGPEHTHFDSEEAFFVLEGEIEVAVHRGTEIAKRKLGYRDMIVVPAGVPRSLKNVSDKPALFAVIIGTGKPQVPSYPETSVMHGITRD